MAMHHAPYGLQRPPWQRLLVEQSPPMVLTVGLLGCRALGLVEPSVVSSNLARSLDASECQAPALVDL